ncbi:SGNH/GDSL hydrolase family protein [Nocardioides sp. C4-1]|uniref:SGNH/GDSL hydrolase family protein n=1 Tax=Nocardioides sp. C4-1 TaxID=3151851 RepID=UPI003265EDAD
MRRWAVVATTLVLLCGCAGGDPSSDTASGEAGAPTATEAVPREPLRVVVAGDSIAAGYYASRPSNSFAELVTTLLGERYDVTSLSAAVPGARTWRIAREARDVMVGEAPIDVAVLEAGANDVGTTTLSAWRRAYRQLLAAVVATSPDAAIVCLGPWGPSVASAPYESVVRRLCADHVYVGLSSAYERPGLRGPVGSATELGPRDAFHPNDRGHAAITRVVMRALDRLGIA